MSEAPDVDALCAKAKECVRGRNLDQAISLFQQVLEVQETNAEALEGIAAAYFHAGNDPGALEYFKRLAELNPLEARPLINLGAVYNRLKDFEQAVDVLRKAVQKDSRSSEAFYNLGLSYRNLDQLGMATTAYGEALRLNPDMPEAHVNLGNVCVEMGNYRKAINHYNDALKLKPGMSRAEAGLLRAKEASEVSKAEISPFGRLVDVNQADGRSVATGGGRVLSSVERAKDRRTVRELAAEIHESAHEMTTQLRDELIEAILEMGRSIAEGADRASNIVENQEHFELSVGRSRVLRKRLRDALKALHDHETKMKSEEAGGQGTP